MDSVALLVRCDLCECLVPASALRASGRAWRDLADQEHKAVHMFCADATACFLRTVNPHTWVRVGAPIPIGREPEPGAPLGQCRLCDIAAHIDDLDVSRRWDADDGEWYASVTCLDEAACGNRQRFYGHTPPEISP